MLPVQLPFLKSVITDATAAGAPSSANGAFMKRPKYCSLFGKSITSVASPVVVFTL